MLPARRRERPLNTLPARDTFWGVNLNMLRMAIQGLEMEKATLTAMQQAMAVRVLKKDP